MLSKNVKVVGLSITEDCYNYTGTFMLSNGEKCIHINVAEITDEKINEIIDIFNLEESVEEIRKEIMIEIFEASKAESRLVEGKNC